MPYHYLRVRKSVPEYFFIAEVRVLARCDGAALIASATPTPPTDPVPFH